MIPFSIFFTPQRELKFVEWEHCYIAIRKIIQAEALSANTEDLQELLDLLVLIESALDIRSISDLEQYQYRYDYQTIRLSDHMWNIIRSIRPISEEELEEEDIDGE
ncbi:MAG: hypothetical protein RLZZ223_153 [Candidatus Parcubacteria bacterium]|jgi:hypothetical protein